jgi:putative transposase
VLGADRSSVRYRAKRADDVVIRMRLRARIAMPPLGYRRLHVGPVMNHKKLRLYHEERLEVRRRSGRKRALGTRTPIAVPQGANQR